ncbi:MAG: phage major capsid protein [[Clostridium] scindens]|uniref:phage major capsid protein n=1 Tax=Clostridium scindens (strain JCM 10418 / VPI 12708) TaxID=29347 RepID=UPI00242DC9FE|nr:phage major capsid protein [[Clostridium] scindens]MCI6394726.1 phage major capsid protein [[Clostridium] scindens]MDY4866214.1 phage major capsid protein [[Clostridium] scindens]
MLGNVSDVKQKEAIAAMQSALMSGDEEAGKQAWQQFLDSVVQTVKEDYEMFETDKRVLVQRGYRQLTKKEEEFYQKMIKAGKSADPKQAFTDLLSTESAMPETIIEDVYRELTEQHPLLSRIKFQNVKYLTRWILNDHSKQSAAWGEINSEIAKEITSSFKTIDVNVCKLSAFAVIPKDMLDLGPVFLDNYIRTILREALYCALEKAVLKGSGKSEPTGLNRDIHKGVDFNSETGYPEKTAIKITSFLPKEYGGVLAELAVTETGRMRTFDRVTLVCNQVDYLTKVMPATTVMNMNGTYSTNLFPFPTDVVRSNELDTGEAILFLPEEYFFGLGGSKDGTIEFTDEYKFLEDQRVFKIKLHGNGRAFDNTVAIVLDISALDPAYITVLNKKEEVIA